MKRDAWMPLWIGDYLRDTMGLCRAEHGSYMLLIMAYWSNGGPLPDDDHLLMNCAACPPQEWQRTKGLMLRFFTCSDGHWHHKRIDKELDTSRRLREQKSEAGKIGGQKRWQTDSKHHGKQHGKPIAERMAEGMATSSQDNATLPASESKTDPPESTKAQKVVENEQKWQSDGKPIANSMAKAWQTDAISPSPSPSPSHTHSPTPLKMESVSSQKQEFQGRNRFEWLERELCSMYKRPILRVSRGEEEHLVAEISRRADVRIELAELRKFRSHSGEQYFPQSLKALCQEWDKTLDRARNQKPAPKKYSDKSITEKDLDRICNEVLRANP